LKTKTTTKAKAKPKVKAIDNSHTVEVSGEFTSAVARRMGDGMWEACDSLLRDIAERRVYGESRRDTVIAIEAMEELAEKLCAAGRDDDEDSDYPDLD
jgi:hypothetical protein